MNEAFRMEVDLDLGIFGSRTAVVVFFPATEDHDPYLVGVYVQIRSRLIDCIALLDSDGVDAILGVVAPEEPVLESFDDPINPEDLLQELRNA